MEVNESHTGKNIAAWMKKSLKKWDVDKKVFLVLRDSGANVKKGIELAGFDSVGCVLHILHNAVRAALNETMFEDLKELVEGVSEICSAYARSQQKKAALYAAQESSKRPRLLPITWCPTRWNTVCDMLERFIVLKPDLVNLVDFIDDDWAQATRLAKVLMSLKVVTMELSEKDATLGDAYIHCLCALTVLKKEEGDLRDFRWYLYHYIEGRLKETFSMNNTKVALACVLDPRCKHLMGTEEQRMTLLMDAVGRYDAQGPAAPPAAQPAAPPAAQPAAPPAAQPAAPPAEPTTGLLDASQAHDDAWSTLAPVAPRRVLRGAVEQIEAYLSEAVQPKGVDVLTYWKGNASVYPCLIPAALAVLSAPPSSVESERVFSQMKFDYNPLRNRLSGTKAGTLARIHSLTHYFGYEAAREMFSRPLQDVVALGGQGTLVDIDDDADEDGPAPAFALAALDE